MFSNVTVIIPVYNRFHMIERAVLSAFQQDEVKEIIIVDDGSTDGTFESCQKLVKKYNNIKLLQHKNGQNKGSGASRNAGIKEASNELIAFLDSDDIYLKNRFKFAVDLFNRYNEVEATYDPYEKINHNGELSLHGVRKIINSKEVFYNIIRGTYGMFNTDTITIKLDSIFKNKLLFNEDLKLHQDTEYWLRLSYHLKIYSENITIPVARVYIHDSNILNKKNNKTKHKYYKIAAEYFKYKDITICEYIHIIKKLLRSEMPTNGIINKYKVFKNNFSLIKQIMHKKWKT